MRVTRSASNSSPSGDRTPTMASGNLETRTRSSLKRKLNHENTTATDGCRSNKRSTSDDDDSQAIIIVDSTESTDVQLVSAPSPFTAVQANSTASNDVVTNFTASDICIWHKPSRIDLIVTHDLDEHTNWTSLTKSVNSKGTRIKVQSGEKITVTIKGSVVPKIHKITSAKEANQITFVLKKSEPDVGGDDQCEEKQQPIDNYRIKFIEDPTSIRIILN